MQTSDIHAWFETRLMVHCKNYGKLILNGRPYMKQYWKYCWNNVKSLTLEKYGLASISLVHFAFNVISIRPLSDYFKQKQPSQRPTAIYNILQNQWLFKITEPSWEPLRLSKDFTKNLNPSVASICFVHGEVYIVCFNKCLN